MRPNALNTEDLNDNLAWTSRSLEIFRNRFPERLPALKLHFLLLSTLPRIPAIYRRSWIYYGEFHLTNDQPSTFLI